MTIKYHLNFKNEFKVLNKEQRLHILNLIKEITQADIIEDILFLKPLRSKNTFSVYIGEAFRVGIRYKSDTLILMNVKHRSIIYNNFP